MAQSLSVLVLAAGQGSRMKSKLPKVLHPVGGRPLLFHVLETVRSLSVQRTAVVLGVGRETVSDALKAGGWGATQTILQPEPKGSGDAVRKATAWLRRQSGSVLVVYGDTPLLKADTLRALVKTHQRLKTAATFLTMKVDNPAGYGRMLVNDDEVESIVEDRDATAEQKKINLVNTGVACWNVRELLAVLPKIRPNNVKKEYYLTDAAALLRRDGFRVGHMVTASAEDTAGINTREDLAYVESILRKQILKKWMAEGVSIIDPATTYISIDAVLEADVCLYPGTMILGKSKIATGCQIGPYSIIEDSVVKAGSKIGPFARLRPGTVLAENVHVGNFVEIKKSTLGRGSKANHLTYLGDSIVGQKVNIGAGTITCNYDGIRKSQTIIDDDVFVGSNANLVAPVRLGKGSVIAAGSTITENVPPKSLSIARTRQLNKTNWKRK